MIGQALLKTSFYKYVDVALLADNHIGDYPPEFIEKCVRPSTPPREAVSKIMKAKIIYLHADGFDYWSDILLEVQQHKPLPVRLFILMDSDYCFGDEHMECFLAFFPTTKFWIQNWCGSLEKVQLLPIGVNMSYQKESNKTQPLGISFLLNYMGNTKREEFFEFLHTTQSILPYCLEKGGFEQYFDQLSRCMFSTCPMGEGFDTYRFWESLMMGAIPIVKKHEFYSTLKQQYPKVAFVEVDNWSDIIDLLPNLTIEYYNSFMDHANLDCLQQSYWIKQLEAIQNAEKQ
jgi:hypothetical protein